MNIFTRDLVLSVVLATSIILCPRVWAQEAERQPSADLAIRLVAPEGYEIKSPVLPPPSEGGWMDTGAFKRIHGWQKPDDGPPLTRIRIKSNYEGPEAVRIIIVAVFDDSEETDRPGPKYGEKEKKIASYLAKKGDTIKVSELEAYGVEPLNLQLVPIKYLAEEPVAGPIEVKLSNLLKGVEVVSFNQSGDRPDEYQITLRNLTEKNIIALQLDQPSEGGGSSQSSEAAYDRALIAPQGTYQDRIYIQPVSRSRRPKNTAGGDTPDPITLIVGTVVYADGSSEGDSKRAAQILAQREGRRAQLLRGLGIIRTFSGNPGEDEAETLRKIRGAIASLRIDAEDDLVTQTLEKFPVLSEGEARKNLAADLLRGLNNGRNELLYRIDEFEKQRKSNSSVRVPTREWLEQLVSGYEATLGSAPH